MNKIRWGVLSTARIGTNHVIPAMQQGTYSAVTAIGSRDQQRADDVAQKMGIGKAYGSYAELLADPEVDAVYNPLPNEQHVAWSIKALEAGKHVLCEKPIALTADEAQTLVDAAAHYPRLKIMEAFMYRFHPQWQRAKQLVTSGAIGDLRTIQSFFSYTNLDPTNIRNRVENGGGGLMDIGCYNISFSRFIFGEEPKRVVSMVEYDPTFKTDRLVSGMLDFPSRPRELYLLDAGFPIPAGQYRWHHGSGRGRNTGQRAGQTSLSDLARARRDHRRAGLRGVQPVHAPGRPVFEGDPG